jgi:hypothetical protein
MAFQQEKIPQITRVQFSPLARRKSNGLRHKQNAGLVGPVPHKSPREAQDYLN